MRPRCLIADCANGASRGFCNYHWQRMPDDLKERYLYVVREGGSAIEYAAALRAIATEAEGELT
jgi:hypothetical protein